MVKFGLYIDDELSRFANYEADIKELDSLVNTIKRTACPDTGLHKDEGKRRFDLIPLSALTVEADVMAFGANKYSENNYQKGIEWHRLFASTLRHLYAWWGRNDLDSESNLSHLGHARACLAMLIENIRLHPELDTRPK